MKTKVSKKDTQFLINGLLVYSEIPNVNPKSLGLLWNQRMIQGVFDDKNDRSRFDIFNDCTFDPKANTDALIAALPEWYAYGLRAITVGFQGGWPVGCVDVKGISNNPFGTDGKTLDAAYARRMDKIIRAADKLGMVVIVSLLYWAQAAHLADGRAVVNAVKTGADFLNQKGYTNVILEVANEYNIKPFAIHPIVYEPEGMANLIKIAREYSGNLMVGASCVETADKEVVEESDIVFIHGNGKTRGEYYDFIRQVRTWAPDKPIICNEDSPCCTRLDVALETGTSWGYYNNYTKQVPPCDYKITQGEDLFFARRMARAVGIPTEELPFEEQFYFQGLNEFTDKYNKRFIRLAAEYPEKIEKVEFYCDDELVYVSYDEPFFCWRETSWLASPWEVDPSISKWKASVYQTDGGCVEKTVKV